MPRYGLKSLFNCFEIGFTAIFVLYLKHWTLFCVNWRYSYLDRGENVNLMAVVLGLQHFQFYF